MFASVTHRLNTFLLVLIALMAASIIAILATRAGAGPLDPPAPPASTNRNIIFEPASCAGFPIAISQPGSYTLGSNITMPGGCTSKDGIDINANNVTLDLNGFSVIGLGSAGVGGSGIVAGSGTTNLRLSNGILNSWAGDGVDFSNASSSAIDRVTASGSTNASGFGLGATSVLSECVSNGNYNGVAALGSNSTVRGCDLSSDAQVGVFVGASVSGVLMAGNHVTNSGTGFRILGNQNMVEDNAVSNAVAPWYLVNIGGSSVGNIVTRNVADNSSDGWTAGAANDVPANGTASNPAAPTAPWADIGN